MNIYFDCEFTELSKNSELISIGLISEDEREFYCEFAGIPNVSDWIKENVLPNTIHFGGIPITNIVAEECDYYYGERTFIKNELINWLQSFNQDIQFVSDVCHYDMILLIDLLSNSALDLPNYISASCHDINQDIARYLEITDKQAFNYNREDFLNEYGNIYVNSENKHNSLYDARVIKDIYNLIWR